jgi:alpha-beta hydrolase superfamily lysophospholipase
MQGTSIFRRLSLIGLLVGLMLLLNVGSAGASSGPAQVPQSETDVSYPGVNGVTLAGTLLIPAHRRGERLPGVVIVAGSGPVDRNGNVAGVEQSNLYEQFAEDLAQHGIASLRYDKRAVGGSTSYPQPKDPQHPTPAEIAAIENFFAWNNYVGDAAASLRYLQSQPAIDSWHTAMLGHSEGTYISEEVATTPYPGLKPPAALVLAGAPGRTIDVLLREQIDNQLTQSQLSASVQNFILQQYDAIIAGIKQTGQTPQQPIINLRDNPQVPTTVTTFFEETFQIAYDKLWSGELQVVPTTLVREYRGPVLILQGTSDTEVFANQDTPLLDEALAQRPHSDHFTLLVPGAGHFLKIVTAINPEGITGPVAPQVLSTLPFWLNLKLSLH